MMLGERYFEDPDTTAAFERNDELRRRRASLVNALRLTHTEDVDAKANQFMFNEFAGRVGAVIDARVESQLVDLGIDSDELRAKLRGPIADQVGAELAQLHLGLPLPAVELTPVLEANG